MNKTLLLGMASASIIFSCGKKIDVDGESNTDNVLSAGATFSMDDFQRLLNFLEKPILRVDGYTQIYPAKVKRVFEKRYGFKPERDATLIYSFMMKPGFEFVKGGKLPGLGGGNATTGCDPIDPGGWSMRYMWRRNGKAVVYAYHLDRMNECGDDWEIGQFTI